MKRLLYIVALAAALSACSKEAPGGKDPGNGGAELMPATLLASASETRTALDGKHVQWLPADSIAVFDQEGVNHGFGTAAGGSTASFTGSLPGDTQEVKAVYPYKKTAALVSGKVQASLPAAQIAVKDGFADDLAVLTASGAMENMSATLHFKQACGLVKVVVAGNDISSVELTAPDGTALAGDALVAFDLSAPTVAAPVSSLTLGPASGTAIAPGTYYFTCWPVAATAGCKVVWHSASLSKTKTLNLDTALAVNRAGISEIPLSDGDLSWDGETPAPAGVTINGTALTETSTGIYEGTFAFDATGTFAVNYKGEDYGFLSYSGAGGIGKCNSVYSALPFCNLSGAKTNKADYGYSVKRAIGRMGKISAGANMFYVNLAAASQIYARINMAATVPEYYFRLEETPDASVVFHEDFDLCTSGGDYMVAIKGSLGNVTDGIAPATKDGRTANQPSESFYYPSGGDPVASETFIANRGFEGWTFAFSGERPGAMQLCSGSVGGYMITPAFSSLTAGSDITVTVDIARFSSSSTDPISLILLGGGTWTTGHVEVEAYAAASAPAQAKDYPSNGTDTFSIVDDAYCPHTLGNSDYDKPHSVFTLHASGAGPATQLKIDAPKGASSAPRCFIFDIKVSK